MPLKRKKQISAFKVHKKQKKQIENDDTERKTIERLAKQHKPGKIEQLETKQGFSAKKPSKNEQLKQRKEKKQNHQETEQKQKLKKRKKKKNEDPNFPKEKISKLSDNNSLNFFTAETVSSHNSSAATLALGEDIDENKQERNNRDEPDASLEDSMSSVVDTEQEYESKEISGLQKNLIALSETNFGKAKLRSNKWCDAISVEDGSVLAVLSHPVVVPLKGRVQICCLSGVANVMGFRLERGKKPCNVFSPDCYSLVTIATEAGEEDKDGTINYTQEHYKYLGVKSSKFLSSLRKTLNLTDSFVTLKFCRIETTLCKFIQSFHQYSNIFKSIGDKSIVNKKLLPLEVTSPGDISVPCLEVPAEVTDILDKWGEELDSEDNPVMLLCGGKNSGKSTTNRLLVNSSLNKRDYVFYLECDIGQTEFTPSGVVSLFRLTEPVFGPPFCHQREPVCAYFFGGVSPKANPDRYLQCVQQCVEYYSNMESPKPLIVNTMGWMKDLGWQLLLDTIRLVSPSLIVQLSSHDRYHNIDPLTLESLDTVSWSDLSQELKSIPGTLSRAPKFIHVEEPISTSHDFKLNPADYRNLSIMSHLGSDLEPGMALTSMIPYTIEWKAVCVYVYDVDVSRSQIMYALNASLVALCTVDTSQAEKYIEDGPMFLPPDVVCKWIGFGIVRGIDPVNKKFYVITSLSQDKLSRVNALVKGGVVLPEQILTQQKGLRLPYVDEVVSTVGIHCKKPRKRMARISFPSNK